MRTYVAMIGHGPRWLEGKSVYEQGPPVEAHLGAMRDRFDAGQLLLGGPFDQGGGIAVLDVPDEATARAIMDADPAVRAGVMVYELKALRPVFHAARGVRSGGSAAQLGASDGRQEPSDPDGVRSTSAQA